MNHPASTKPSPGAGDGPGNQERGKALLVENLTKRFNGRTAFADVSFTVDHGEVFGFLGLCDRVAILSTTLRTIGRPDELREQLFRKTLVVKTLTPPAEPETAFGGLLGVEAWHEDSSGACAVSVSDTTDAAPAITRSLVAAGADVLSIGESRHSLEDVFLELIDEDVEAQGGRR